MRQFRQPFPLGDDARIRRVDAIHVRAKLAELRANRGGQRHGRGVAAAPAERGDFLLPRHALIARDDHDAPSGQLLQDPHRTHFEDARVGVRSVGDDSALRPREADCLDAAGVQRHPEQRHRDALARGEQHVHLASAGVARDIVRQPHEIVGRLAHRRHHCNDVVARPARSDDVIRHCPDPIRVGDGRPAELLNQETHDLQGYRRPR